MKKLLLIFTLLSLLAACGGKEEFGNTVIDNTPGLTAEEKAVLKIANYVKNNPGKAPPLSLFTDAAIVGVNETNKESIAKLLSLKDFDTVNNHAELQTLVSNYNKAIKKVQDFAKDKGDAPTVADFVDIGVDESELQTKIDTLKTQIKGLKENQLDKISLISILELLKKI